MKTLCVTLRGKLEIHQHYHRNDTTLGENQMTNRIWFSEASVCWREMIWSQIWPPSINSSCYTIGTAHRRVGVVGGADEHGREDSTTGRGESGWKPDWLKDLLFIANNGCMQNQVVEKNDVKNGTFSGSLGKVISKITVWHAVGDVQLKYRMGTFNIWLDLRCENWKEEW